MKTRLTSIGGKKGHDLKIPRRRVFEYPAIKYYGDIIARYIVIVAYHLNLTPNVLTGLSLGCGILSAASFIVHQPVLAAIFLQFHFILDLADGNLARLTNKHSAFGAKLDKVSDQLIRALLFPGIAWVAPVPLWAKVMFVATIYLDLAVVHLYVLPFARKKPLIRAPWKQWFLDQGIIIGFDIFLVFCCISFFAVIHRLDILVYVVIIGKNWDWLYRVYECLRTTWLERQQVM